MTDRKDDGGPFHCSGIGYPQYYGATYREVAAMHAMAAVILRLNDDVHDSTDIAIEAVAYADALIAELKK